MSDLGALPGFAQLQSPEVIADPYPWYARLRADGPVRQLDDDLWIAVGYDAVTAALHDPTPPVLGRGHGRAHDRPGRTEPPQRPRRVRDRPARPPRPDRRRSARPHPPAPAPVPCLHAPRPSPSSSPASARSATPWSTTSSTPGPDGDLVAQVAYPFPVTVIAELLGIPAERRDDFKRWSDALVGALSGSFEPVSAQQSILEMFGYLADVVADRAIHPDRRPHRPPRRHQQRRPTTTNR